MPIDYGEGGEEAGEGAAPASKEQEVDDLGAKKGQGNDDLVSQMPIESYIDCRVRKYADYLELRAPTMSRRFNQLESAALAANTAGAVLAVSERWVGVDWERLPSTLPSHPLCMARA